MADLMALREAMSDSGMTVKAIAQKSGILRETLYNRLNGTGQFTASEIVALTETLNLSKIQRDDIFLRK